jgi:hypothetical protein
LAEGLEDEDRNRVRDAEDEVLDHLDRTGYRTFSDRALAVQNHLPLFLRAIEEKLVRGDVGRTRRVVIDHAALPHGAF